MYQHSSTVNASQEVNFDTCSINYYIIGGGCFFKIFSTFISHNYEFSLVFNMYMTYMYSKHPYLVGCLGPANLPQNENPGLFAQM